MASHIAALGTLRYETENFRSVTFPGDSKCSISSRHIKTSDGRGIKAVEHTLTVTGWMYSADLVSSTGTVDQAFATARQILSQSGGRLTIIGKGFGDYYVNRDSGINRDVAFGPFPEVVEWEPFGNVTCRFTWRVVFTLPWKDNSYVRGGILDYSWETSYSYDAQGFCTRTTTGELEIAAGRDLPGRALLTKEQHIEHYILNTVICSCPLGWRRTGHEIKINASKTKANVSFTDEPEAGLVYPPGIVDMEVTHKMSSAAAGFTLANWTWAFTANATPSANVHPIIGYEACLAAHQSRFLYMARRSVNQNGTVIPYPVHFEISENVKKRTTSLTAVWNLVVTGSKSQGTFTPADILMRSGMWQPFPFRSENAKQVADLPYGPNRTGAFSRLLSDPTQNVIIEVSSSLPGIPDIGAAAGNKVYPLAPREDALIVAPVGKYIEFKLWFSVATEGGQWVNFELGDNPYSSTLNKGITRQKFLAVDTYNKYLLKGHILRVGIPPAKLPVCKKIGGMEVVQAAGEKAFYETKPILSTCGTIIWQTKFEIPLTAVKPDDSKPNKEVGAERPRNTKGLPNIPDDAILDIPNIIEGENADQFA